MNKKWYASKTIWVNALTLFVGMIGYAAGSDLIKANPEYVAMLVALQGAVNVGLRFVTGKSIS